ncbi:hypothetical protein ABK040_011182 [Willaertia magna]
MSESSSLFQEFKERVFCVRIVATFLSGIPHSNDWAFPDFLLSDENRFAAHLGYSYEPYSKMGETEKKTALRWYETSGAEVNKMLDMIDWEDWDGCSAVDCDVVSFAVNHPDLYKKVIHRLVEQAFSEFEQEEIEKVREMFLQDPKRFGYEMSRNVRRLRIKQ